MGTIPDSANDAAKRPAAGAKFIRAGWVTIAIGYLAALICAIVLAQEIRSLEDQFSTFHRWSQFVMLAGCVMLSIGYRIRQEQRAKAWQQDRSGHGDLPNEIIVAEVAEAIQPGSTTPISRPM